MAVNCAHLAYRAGLPFRELMEDEDSTHDDNSSSSSSSSSNGSSNGSSSGSATTNEAASTFVQDATKNKSLHTLSPLDKAKVRRY